MRSRRWLVVIGICLGLVLVLGLVKFMQIRAAIAFGESFPEPSETVMLESVKFSEWQPRISVIGEVRASREVVLRNEVEGIIARIGFQSGQEVQQGDVLLQLDISEEQAQLEAIQPQIELAKQNVARVSGLGNKSAVSRQQADNFKSQLAIARAQAASVNEIIANKTVIAPFSGTAGLHDFEVGEYLSANTLITRLVGNLETLWIDFALPQRYASLKVGTAVSVSVSDTSKALLQAEVSAVEPNISSVSRNLGARATLVDPTHRFKPGAIVQVRVPVSEPRQIVRLPSTAIRTDILGEYVFVVNKDDNNDWRAARRPVTVVAKEGNDSIVSAGLSASDVVATMGSFKLSEGLLVYESDKSPAESESHSPPQTPTEEEPGGDEITQGNADLDPATLIDAELMLEPMAEAELSPVKMGEKPHQDVQEATPEASDNAN